MSSGLRERKKDGTAKTEKSQELETTDQEDTKKTQADLGPVDLEPDFKVALALVLSFFAVLGIFFYYKVDNRNPKGPFAQWVNANILPTLKKWFVPENRYQRKGL